MRTERAAGGGAGRPAGAAGNNSGRGGGGQGAAGPGRVPAAPRPQLRPFTPRAVLRVGPSCRERKMEREAVASSETLGRRSGRRRLVGPLPPRLRLPAAGTCKERSGGRVATRARRPTGTAFCFSEPEAMFRANAGGVPKEAGVAFSSRLGGRAGARGQQEVEVSVRLSASPVVSAHCSGGSLGGDLF